MPLIFIIFVILLFLSNAFLFRDGQWFYQDQSFWFKNSLEAFAFFFSQFHSFINLSYYLGYDQGILSANNTFVYSVYYSIHELFGSAGSQAAVSVLAYIITFLSFWGFASLFFKDKKIQLVLSLLYTFNPLMYSFRGHGIIYAAAPLFVYSFYKYYISENKSSRYLLLNIVASFLWIANVRFLQANLFIIVPYLLLALLTLQKPKLYLKKLTIYTVVCLLIFSPVIYSLFAPLFQKSPSIFNFGSVFNNYVVKGSFYDVFNPFQSSNVILYDSKLYLILGIVFFMIVLLLTLKHFKKKPSVFVTANVVLMVLGMTFFELGVVVGRQLYPIIIKFLPFLTNAPFYGYYIVNVPLLFLVGLIGLKQKRIFYLLSAYFIILALLPLLQLSNFILQKYPLQQIPEPYRFSFIDSYEGIPEATHYYPSPCWRAEYMELANTPTQCFNRGVRYPTIAMDNPRAISGEEAYIVHLIQNNANVNNLRLTHNLKNIFVAKDIVPAKDAGPAHDEQTLNETQKIDEALAKNKELTVVSNEYFNHYTFVDKNDFDFFIYSPQKVLVKANPEMLLDNSLTLRPKPVILLPTDKQYANAALQQDIALTIKHGQFDATKYYVKLDNISDTANKQFMVHLTQSFKPGWELMWIDKTTYEQKRCIEQQVSFPLTNNKRCRIEDRLVDIETLGLINTSPVNEKKHLRGNFVGNTWIINPADIPREAIEKDTAYAVLIYKNQLYLTLTMIVSGIVLLFVILYTLMQEIIAFLHKKR